VPRYAVARGPAAEAHAVHARTEREREAERNGRRHEEEHRR